MRHHNQNKDIVDSASDKLSAGRMVVLLSAIAVFMYLMAHPALAVMDLADEPLMVKIKPAAPMIMFVLDDSGSMDRETMTSEEEGNVNGKGYVFADPGDNIDGSHYQFGAEERKFWKSQWAGYNKLYYNPGVNYEPWPNMGNAHTSTPRSNPNNASPTLGLADTFHTLASDIASIAIPNAHYYTWNDADQDGKLDVGETIYLVNFVDNVLEDGKLDARDWYVFNDADGNDKVAAAELAKVEESSVPQSVRPDFPTDDLQNFANWFSYYRKRNLTATAAIANVIVQAREVQIGFYGINGTINVPLRNVNVQGVDETGNLLNDLYGAPRIDNSTPLRTGLQEVGKYFDISALSAIGESPYAGAIEGGACQQAFAILMTDGYWNGGDPDLPGDGNIDGETSDNGYIYPEPYHDGYSNTLADVAMYYYARDLHSGLDNLVPINPRDNAGHQHMVTFGIGFGVDGSLIRVDYDLERGPYPIWPDPKSTRNNTIDDLWHATVNGRGQFFSADNPDELSNALTEIINDILNRAGSGSSVSVNGDGLYGQIDDDILLFQASYNTFDWSGDVKAYQVNTDTGDLVAEPKWSAAADLDKQYWDNIEARQWNNRKILSYNGSAGIEFKDTAVSSDQKAILGSDFANVIDHIRGNPDLANFRSRPTLLGDIVHSSPVFENNVVYVGANDGMLHAFKITVTTVANKKVVSGEEIFAYVPGLVYENLVQLTQPAYAHKYFVDLTPVTGKGYGLLGGSEVETILVGGLGKGGKGIFALDITDTNNMSAGDVLWEFPNNGTSQENKDYMGYSFSTPVVVQTNSTADGESWVVILANGYDSDSTSGKAVLFILNPITGEVIRAIPAHNTTIDTIGSDNGLSSPIAVDVNYDRKVDFVYAGDLYGNMWKFDLSGNNSTQWTVAYKEGADDQPLFQAKGPGGTIQPITSKPDVMFHPQMSGVPARHGLMVLFGTGKFLEDSDLTDVSQQAVYGIWDYGDRALYRGAWGDYSNDDDREYLGYFNFTTQPYLFNQSTAVTLQEQTATPYTVPVLNENNVLTDITVRVMSENELTWATVTDTDPLGLDGAPNLDDLSNSDSNSARNAGWFWDLPLTGERVISDVHLRSGRLIVISFTPETDRCSDGGTSFLMEIDSGTGGNVGGTIFDITSDYKINDDDMVIVGYNNNQLDDPIKKPPSGLNFPGNIQPPAISILNDKIEVKYMSSSTGSVYIIREKAVKLGISYWKEMEQ